VRLYSQFTLPKDTTMGRWLRRLLLIVVLPLEVCATDAPTIEVPLHGTEAPATVKVPVSLETSALAEVPTVTKTTPVVVKTVETASPLKTPIAVETPAPPAEKVIEASPPVEETSIVVKTAPAVANNIELVTHIRMPPSSEIPSATEDIIVPKAAIPQTTAVVVEPVLLEEDEGAILAAATLVRPSASSLAQVERAVASDPKALPRLAAMLLGRNNRGDASRATFLLERFLRQQPAGAQGSVQLLLLLARGREIRTLSRRGGCVSTRDVANLAQTRAEQTTDFQDNELIVLRRELVEAREERDAARHEAMELRRKLKDLTSIERSMDERKSH